MSLRLSIAEAGYTLAEHRDGGWIDIAVLHQGAEALLSSRRPIDEASLEAAIESAEDWLMPHAARLSGRTLEVDDFGGRIKEGLEELLSVRTSEWNVDEVEQFFLSLVDLATGRHPAPGVTARHGFVADVLLLRELAHHGSLRAIRLA